MARVPIRRAFTWLTSALDQKDSAGRGIDSFWSGSSPVVDLFGTHRLGEIQFDDVNGTLGGIEATHTQVPDDKVRFYAAMQYSHDDAVNRFIAPVVIVGTPTGFPAVAYDGSESVASGVLRSIRNVYVPPRGFIGARASAMGAGARLILRVLFVDLPIGEYVRGGQV